MQTGLGAFQACYRSLSAKNLQMLLQRKGLNGALLPSYGPTTSPSLQLAAVHMPPGTHLHGQDWNASKGRCAQAG